MAQPAVPQVAGGGGRGEDGMPWEIIAEEGVQITGATGDHDDFPGSKILHNKTRGKEFN